jgi:hypothetical protein
MRLWCDNALGECWENTQEACKTLGNASFLHALSYSPNISRVYYHIINARDSFSIS